MALDLGVNVPGAEDVKVKVSNTDTKAATLIEKLVSSDTSVGIAIQNQGGVEKIDLTAAGVGGGMVIGNAVTGGTNGSVLFVGSGNLAQDNSNLFWDDTNNRLGIRTSTLTRTLNVSGQIRLGDGGDSEIYVDNSSSGSLFTIRDETPGFNIVSIQLATTGGLTQLQTSGGAWGMNKNLRLDTVGAANLYVNNGGSGLQLNGGNTVSGHIRINNAGDVGIGITAINSRLAISGLPTSSAGLLTGDVWSNSGVLNII